MRRAFAARETLSRETPKRKSANPDRAPIPSSPLGDRSASRRCRSRKSGSSSVDPPQIPPRIMNDRRVSLRASEIRKFHPPVKSRTESPLNADDPQSRGIDANSSVLLLKLKGPKVVSTVAQSREHRPRLMYQGKITR